MSSPFDLRMMRRALFHAARGVGQTTPNPMVGAVIVSREGVVLGDGYHERAGGPHAEINAFNEVQGRIEGATLYVTLEPCCHVGRTGPCTQRIIGSGIARVVAAMRDPDPRVSGRGFEQLRAHGIAVEEGLCEREARRLNEAFILTRTAQRPLVILKAATGLDARIAAASGERTVMTSIEADRRSHLLRASIDAIAVGSDTLLIDDPQLTPRHCFRMRPLLRVVFDRRLRTPATARVFSTLDAGSVIILTSQRAYDEAAAARRALERAGGEVVAIDDLNHAMRLLLARDVSTLLVEGGARLQAAFWDAALVDRLLLIVAPRMLGEAGTKLFDGRRVPTSALSLRRIEVRGADTWIESDVHRHR